MTEDNEARPVSDPAESGIPEHADDDSTANPKADVGRQANGPDAAALPLDREDQPVGLDRTLADELRGETWEERLKQEAPEGGEPIGGGPVGGGPVNEGSILDPAAKDASDPGLDTTEPEEALPGSTAGDEPAGRLIEPDEGAGADVETDVVGYDVGPSGGGASAEEQAVHERTGQPAEPEE